MQNFRFMRYILPILLLISVCMTGCLDSKDKNAVVSSDARVSTFTFQIDTANPGLQAVTYKIEHRSDTGLIHSVDSLPFGTRLDSIIPLVTYMATPGLVNFVLPDTTITSTGMDTINFNHKPIYLHVTASDMKTEKWYLIDIAAHQADPDLFVWECLTTNLFSPAAIPNCQTKAFRWDNQLVVYVNNGLSTSIYVSNDGEYWTQQTAGIATLPVPCHVRDIVQHGNTLYYIDGTCLYTSNDLQTWTKVDYADASFTPINMLMSYNGYAWCILQDKTNEQLLLGTITDSIRPMKNIADMDNGYLPSTFPINDFAALEFSSSSERPRAMIVGGRALNGDIVKSRWNLEYTTYADNGDTYRLKDFSIAQPTFESLTGVSIIQYEGRLMMFGGTDNDLTLRSDILYSDDEGMNWYLPNPSSNKLPSSYLSRSNQSVVVDNDNNIYIIGGESYSRSWGDVYRGFLNSSKWQ